MARMDARLQDALRFFQRMARSGGVRVSRKAQHEFDVAYGEDSDVAEIWEAVCAAAPADVHKLEPDHADATKTVIVLRLPFLGGSSYVKATMKMGVNESACLLSCKPWGR